MLVSTEALIDADLWSIVQEKLAFEPESPVSCDRGGGRKLIVGIAF